jgi:hypothetical protein
MLKSGNIQIFYVDFLPFSSMEKGSGDQYEKGLGDESEVFAEAVPCTTNKVAKHT